MILRSNEENIAKNKRKRLYSFFTKEENIDSWESVG